MTEQTVWATEAVFLSFPDMTEIPRELVHLHMWARLSTLCSYLSLEVVGISTFMYQVPHCWHRFLSFPLEDVSYGHSF